MSNGEIDGFSFQRQISLPRLRLTGDLADFFVVPRVFFVLLATSVPVERLGFDGFFECLRLLLQIRLPRLRHG